jgi:DNA replication protein DnaC
LFTTAAYLVNTLVEAREERQLKRYLARLLPYSAVICDELGYIPFSPEGAQLLFQVFADRYERGSLLVTCNLPFAQWFALDEITVSKAPAGKGTLTAMAVFRKKARGLREEALKLRR